MVNYLEIIVVTTIATGAMLAIIALIDNNN